jgi:hypothetical protein
VALVTGDWFPWRWPNRAGLGSGTDYATCVIYLGPWQDLARFGDAVAMVAVALHGGAHRHARVRAVLVTGVGANGAVRVHGAKTNQGRVRAALQEAHHSEAATRAAMERRQPAFHYLGYATAYDI